MKINDPRPTPLRFYLPSEVADRLRCSEWWVKEQARRRRVPYCWIGGAYRFTEQHVEAIAQLFEVQACDAPVSRGRVSRAAKLATETSGPAARLSARVPRRARVLVSQSAA